MAPSRRKGVNKAAAAAIARQKWKVGDLVLAKVKGFPAWPATVCEPRKWGYTADQKKIVVEFFGCKQIAFCNPVDIEEFTEEKKGSLLGKRHGKGADFSRAVNEIVDCFEKLKKQELVSGANGTEETKIINENNSQESVVASKKDEAPVAKVDPLSAGTTNDLDSLTEAAVAAAAGDAFGNEDMENKTFLTEIPRSTPYLTRNRTGVTRSRNSGSTKRKPARRLRSSSRIGSRLRSTTVPSVTNNRASRRFCANASEDRSIRRSRRIVKSSEESGGQNVDSLAFIANDFIEESKTGIMGVNTATLSIDDGSTVDSVSKLVRAGEPATENNECETDLSYRLDFQGNNVIKKKRKPNRKRHNTDTVDPGKLNIVASDIEEPKTVLVSSCFSEKSAPKQAKDDGDEHLPLVKRARVRMGRPSPTVEEEFPSVDKEEQMSEVPERHSVQSFEPLSSKVDDHANNESVPIKEDSSLSSLSHVSPANRASFLEARKDFVDGEAALPPSKRLHRALEAMSANVAEDCRRTSNCSPATKIESNGYCASSLESYDYEISEGKKDIIELAYTYGAMDHQRNSDSLLSVPESCIVSDVGRSEIGIETTVVVSDSCKANTSRKDLELCTGSSELAEDDDDTKDPNIFPFVEVPAEINPIVEDHLKMETENPSERLASFNCNEPSAALSPTNCSIPGCTELKEASKGSDPDSVGMLVDFTSMPDITVGLPNIDTCNQPDDEGDDAHKTGDLTSVEHNLDSNMSECMEEARPRSLDSNIMHHVTPVKVLNSVHDLSLVHSTSFSYKHTEDRTLSATQSSSSLTDGPESIARTSPPSSTVCNISDLDSKKNLVNNSSSCHDIHLHLEKAKLAGKSSNKSEALSSLEAIIKSLTRTKESIGRATRIAIDCAKFGFAPKVMEILAHNLESESSLPKKVDLFFLVDSIAQCSRGLKGDGGVYPSAIQALLPRLLLAAAPPNCSSLENHRQCLKVLKVWQERKILPESIIRHHIRELDAICTTIGSNRTLRNERAFDDPIREMEGMLVDEYGSNSSIQLPGFCMPRMTADDGAGCDSDGESFEAVTPEHIVGNHEVEKSPNSAVEKRRHILEDVDGELEMEDLAPCCENEIVSTSNFGGLDQAQMSYHQPKNIPLASAHVLRSPLPLPLPPPPHPLPPSGFPHAPSNSVSKSPHSKPYSISQNYNGNLRECTNVDAVHHRFHENKDYEAEVPKYMPDNGCFSDRPTSRFSGRASVCDQPNDGFGKSFHLRPPHPSPSNQFSYVQEQRVHSRRDAPPHPRTNKFHSRNSNNGNFYRDRDRSKFVHRDHIGDGWRPPYPSSISGPCYPDASRMGNEPMSHGPPREPPGPNNRWNYPSWPMNHRHFNSYRPPSDAPIPVANRGPHYWRPR